MSLTERPASRRVMARWRAVNSSLRGPSVVRPLAVAYGGNSSESEGGENAPGVAKAMHNRHGMARRAGGLRRREVRDALAETY
jgi:hypothetical protein